MKERIPGHIQVEPIRNVRVRAAFLPEIRSGEAIDNLADALAAGAAVAMACGVVAGDMRVVGLGLTSAIMTLASTYRRG
jgi:hypothetical protein